MHLLLLSLLVLSVTFDSTSADTLEIQWVSTGGMYAFRAAESTGCTSIAMIAQNESEFDVTGYNCTDVASYTIALFGLLPYSQSYGNRYDSFKFEYQISGKYEVTVTGQDSYGYSVTCTKASNWPKNWSSITCNSINLKMTEFRVRIA